ncbi:MAG TPA: tail fiber protein [Bryobacteraceae bacterium]|nr:tail fiber protein [Bryobacteraceae bacterium]
MSQPYIGEIRMAGFSFPPQGWAKCDGTIVAISQNDALFTLIGTTYGGDGQETFALPNLQSRIPIHLGPSIGQEMGAMGGTEQVTLTTQQMPVHNHPLLAADAIGGAKAITNNLLARTSTINLYSGDAPDTAMAPQAIGATGGSQPHDNIQPYLCINFIISLYGIFPQQS